MRIPLKTSKHRLILAMKLVFPGPRHINVTFSTGLSQLDEFEILMVLKNFLQNFCHYFEPNHHASISVPRK